MMDFVLFIAQNPQMAVTVISLFVACFLVVLLYLQWNKRTKESEKIFAVEREKFDARATSVETKIDGLTSKITGHQENLGIAVQSISGELLKTKEQIFEMRSGLAKEVETIRSFTAEVNRNMQMATEITKIAIDNLNQKIGRVITLEQNVLDISQNLGKVRTVADETAAELIRNRLWFKQTGDHLARQKEELFRIKDELAKKK